MSLGPTLADGERLWFDSACSVQVVAVDLEAEERGLELVRRWGREGWTWVEQPASDTGAIEVLRDAAGNYIGRARGETRLQRTASRPAMNTKGHGPFNVTFLGKAATFNLMYAFPFLLLAKSDSSLGAIAFVLGWSFAAWGIALYIATGISYSREGVSQIRGSRVINS